MHLKISRCADEVFDKARTSWECSHHSKGHNAVGRGFIEILQVDEQAHSWTFHSNSKWPHLDMTISPSNTCSKLKFSRRSGSGKGCRTYQRLEVGEGVQRLAADRMCDSLTWRRRGCLLNQLFIASSRRALSIFFDSA